ncbi:MAG: glutamate--cysteine ligase [Polynucleobacter sp. 32-46-5]|nr:MAG: glutamate--cysteine ligase [Polynucleobacter sp. 32-46-5]
MVPHLITALSGPLLELESKVLEATPTIERWFRLEWQEHTPPFYCSVDLRNAGFKLAPVDTNLFPGGFNNLSPQMLPLAVQAAMAAIEKICPEAKNLLLIPERHTRNTFYLQNIARLASILRQSGLNVRLGTLSDEIKKPTWIELPDGNRLLMEPLSRLGLKKQRPGLHAGWHVRRKSNHFAAYDEVAKRFAKVVDIDPWMINPYFASCSNVNFHERKGEEELQTAVEQVLKKTAKKYREYGIKEKPYVVVKADAGTYGMGVMVVNDPAQLKGLNRKDRNKMSIVKEGLEVSDVLIQEGVYTFEKVNEAVAEPVVYMIDRYVIGGFYRVHTDRGPDENLNAPGMHFVPLAFEQYSMPDLGAKPGSAPPNRFYLYGVVARLALLASSLELERSDPNAEVA